MQHLELATILMESNTSEIFQVHGLERRHPAQWSATKCVDWLMKNRIEDTKECLLMKDDHAFLMQTVWYVSVGPAHVHAPAHACMPWNLRCCPRGAHAWHGMVKILFGHTLSLAILLRLWHRDTPAFPWTM